MATNKTTVSIYADESLLKALNEFKDDCHHKSLNVAIVAILREKLFGEASGNIQSALQNQVSSTLDIESIVNDAIAPILTRLQALENTRSVEAAETENFTKALMQKAKALAPLKLQKAA